MRWFETRGPVYPEDNYVVARTDELVDFMNRLKRGRYVVLFAPRQTGKTTFFRNALNAFEDRENTYFPIQLNFEGYVDSDASTFYVSLCEEICKQIKSVIQNRQQNLDDSLNRFLASAEITEHISMRKFFEDLGNLLEKQRFVMIIDEFDGIPQGAIRGFLHSLRHIYLSGRTRCPTASASSGSRTSHNSTTTILSHLLIYKTNSNCQISHYQAGKAQLAAYVKSEGAEEGYYVVFDRRNTPEPRVETETLEGLTIRSYVIPVIQEPPSD